MLTEESWLQQLGGRHVVSVNTTREKDTADQQSDMYAHISGRTRFKMN